jgi:acetoacetyl-CoA synthetase
MGGIHRLAPHPDQFDWVYRSVSDAPLSSISGGTDIIGCFAMGVPTLPVRRGEIQARALGMAVEAWDESGTAVSAERASWSALHPSPRCRCRSGTTPTGPGTGTPTSPSTPVCGRTATSSRSGPKAAGSSSHGRSDTTLNPGGVRIGTAEIYRAVETLDEVADSIAVGHEADGDVEVVLFVVPSPGVTVDDDLVALITATIRDQTSPRHVPRRVIPVDAVPYTISGKKVEKAVRLILSGEAVTNRDALANPDSLDQFEGILEE